MSVLASMFLVGCSQEELTSNGETENNGDTKTNYLSVNLMSSDGVSSRAADGYEDGSVTENKITKIRFYFFTETGAPSNVKLQGTKYVNYYDWTPTDENPQKDDTNLNDDIESTLKQATLVINTKSGDKLPSQIAAVINPTETTVSSRSLQTLKNLTNDYAKEELTKEGKFVMFNSVYGELYGENRQEISAVAITSENLAPTVSDAIAHPINIYVERNVAKVTVDIANEVGFKDGRLALKDKGGVDLKVNGKQVYLKINGWKLTAETDKGRLGKRIDPNWDYSWWNGTYRSCWAINSSEAKNRYSYSYNDIKNMPDALYTNENAEDYTNSNHETTNLNRTKVVLTGTLLDADDKEFTIVRHMGAHFADTYTADEASNLPELRKNILTQLKANGYNYYYLENRTYKEIDYSDIKIVMVKQDEKENTPANDCYVYAQLSDAGAKKEWYDTNLLQPEDAKALTLDREKVHPINKVLADNGDNKVVDRALVWRDGMTYYFYEVLHKPTLAGVVRNHVYKTKVTKIAGYGTPVYDPDQKIYPEQPDPNDHYIAAQINILSWHIVSNNYELEW